MRRPPRDPREPLLSSRTLGVGVLQGATVGLIVVLVFAIALFRGHAPADARALTFAALIIANLGLLLANRSWTEIILATVRVPNPALWWIVGGTVVVLGAVLSVPALRNLFEFSVLHPDDLAIAVLAGVAGITWFEALKLVRRRPVKVAADRPATSERE